MSHKLNIIVSKRCQIFTSVSIWLLIRNKLPLVMKMIMIGYFRIAMPLGTVTGEYYLLGYKVV
jgi:hypothetical protein